MIRINEFSRLTVGTKSPSLSLPWIFIVDAALGEVLCGSNHDDGLDIFRRKGYEVGKAVGAGQIDLFCQSPALFSPAALLK